jgi:hypothetical protein
MASKTVHGSEVRLNYLGAEASIMISVIGVLCVALAFRFWMLLAGEYRYSDRYSYMTDTFQHSLFMR